MPLPYILVAPVPENPTRYRFTIRNVVNAPSLESANAFGDPTEALRAGQRVARLLRAVTTTGPARLLVATEDHEPEYPPQERDPEAQS